MALPVLDAVFASSADLPRRQLLSKWLVEQLSSGSIADFYTLPERLIWAKIAVAAGCSKFEVDYISLPARYVWSDIYNAVAGLIPPSNVLVSGAGSDVNGIYTYRGEFDGKKYYNLVGRPNNPFIYSIAWDNEYWFISNDVDFCYVGSVNAEFPWLVETWELGDQGDLPTPTLTEIPQPSQNYNDWSEKEALGHIAAAYRGDTANPALVATYINWPWRYQVAAIINNFYAPVYLAASGGGIWKLTVDSDGIVTTELMGSGSGVASVLVKSPNSSVFSLTVDDSGILTVAPSGSSTTRQWISYLSGSNIFLIKVDNSGILTTEKQ